MSDKIEVIRKILKNITFIDMIRLSILQFFVKINLFLVILACFYHF